MQFGAVGLTGPDDAPSLGKPMKCGAGVCRRCGIWFTLLKGVAVIVAAPAGTASVEIPDRLARAGVHPPPRQPA